MLFSCGGRIFLGDARGRPPQPEILIGDGTLQWLRFYKRYRTERYCRGWRNAVGDLIAEINRPVRSAFRLSFHHGRAKCAPEKLTQRQVSGGGPSTTVVKNPGEAIAAVVGVLRSDHSDRAT